MAVLSLKDGSVETILQPEDFQYLLDDYLGYDAVKYFENLIERLQEEADYTKAKVETDLGAYESQLDSCQSCFIDLLDLAETMEKLLRKSRLNRTKLLGLIDQIQIEINNQI